MQHTRPLIAGLLAFLLTTAAGARTQGVTDDEVVVGGMHDLSGVFAAFSVSAVEAANLYFEQVNEAGGVHGRTIRYVVEDHGYQVPRAMQAANKLINRDQVFAMLLNLGTPHNLAAFRIMDRKGIPNLHPLTMARQLLPDPPGTKFLPYATYYDGVKATVAYLARERGSKTVCSMYIPSDFGNEIHAGAVDAAEELGLTFGTESTHKPDEADYQGALSKLEAAGCDLIALGLAIRGVITAVGTAKKLGMDDVDFMVSSAGYHSAIPAVPGGVTDGLWAGAGWRDIGERADEPEIAAWIEDYRAATGSDPNTAAQLGNAAARLFVTALEAAGPDLTTESFLEALKTLDYEDQVNGNRVKLGPDDYVASDEIYISQIRDGLWRFVEQAR